MTARLIYAFLAAILGTVAIGVALRWLGSRHSGAHVLCELAALFCVALVSQRGRRA